MILLVAVIIGLSAALLRSYWRRRSLRPLHLSGSWLAIVAVLPQLLIFNDSALRSNLPVNVARVVLVSSQVLLLVFVWLNRRETGLWLAGLGLGLNFLVIVVNGGFMPISPEMVLRVAPGANPASWAVGERLWAGKDVVLPFATTRLAWLSDYLTLPAWIPYRVAFSIGDGLIAAGVAWLFWSLGNSPISVKRETHDLSEPISQHVF